MINMIRLPKDITFRDYQFLSLDFFIPDSFDRKIYQDKKRLTSILWEFYDNYIDISQKYSIGEFIPKVLLKKYNINLKKDYRDYLQHEIEVVEDISFFHGKHEEFKTLYPGNCLYYLISQSKERKSGYFYLDRGKATSVEEYDYKSLPSRCEAFSIYSIGTSISNIIEDGVEEDDVYFNISINTDFWFPETNISFVTGESYNNRYLSYHNTPRLNSYIRDLRKLWVNKLGWGFDVAISSSEVSKTGEILLDGNIVYQEDIDEGNVSLPSIEEYLG